MAQLVRLQSPASALVLLRFYFGWCQASTARTMHPDSLLLCAKKMQTSLMRCLGDISRKQAQVVPSGKGGIRCSTPRRRSWRPAAAAGLWVSYSTTPDPDVMGRQGPVSAQRSTMTWRGTQAVRLTAKAFFCLIHTLDTLTEQATQGDWISLDSTPSRDREPGKWADPPPPLFDWDSVLNAKRSCNTACASPVPRP